MVVEKKESIIGTDYYVYEKIGKMESDIEYLGKSLNDFKEETSKQFDKLDEKIDTVVNSLDEKIDKLDEKIDTVANSLDEKIDTVANKLDEKIDKLDEKIDTVANSLDEKIDKKFNVLLVMLGLRFTVVATLITIFNFV